MLIAALTLTPDARSGGVVPITCWTCDQHALTDVILNLALFAPLGAGLGVAGVRRLPAAVLLLAITIAVEALQLGVVSGRDPSVRDVVANVAGGALGMLLGTHWRTFVQPHPRRAWKLAAGARLVWVAVHLAAAWLLGPSLPAKPAMVITGTHVGGFRDFAGQVTGYQLQTVAAPRQPGADPRDRVLAGVAAVMRPGPRVPELTPIVTVVEQRGVFPVLLGVDGDDLRLRLRTRAADLHLRSPELRFRQMIRPWYREGNQPLLVRALRTSEHAKAEVRSPSGALIEETVPVRTTQWWAMLWPTEHAFDSRPDLASALWCALLLLPLGRWTAGVSEQRRPGAWSLAIVAVVSGLAMGPLLFNLALPGWPELVGCAVGLALGAATMMAAAWRRGRRDDGPELATSPAIS